MGFVGYMGKITRLHILLAIIATSLMLVSCEKLMMDDRESADAVENFDYLWQRVDEQYSLFDVKEVDWQRVYDTLRPKVYNGMTRESLFDVMRTMLRTLHDGHVNLFAPFDVARDSTVWQRIWQQRNIDEQVVMLHYLGPNYHTIGGLRYVPLADSAVIYVRYSSFESSVSVNQLQYVVQRYAEAQGMIIDVRQNGGGLTSNIWEFLKLMPSHGQTLYTTQIKAGRGHDDFSTPVAVTAPTSCQTPYGKPVVLLTDRGSYSATSILALCAKAYDNITVVGDTTGGGLAMPNGGELPNGWRYRFSITRTVAPDGSNFENGMPPDHTVILSPAATTVGRDNVIDSAVAMIKKLNG